MGLKLEGAIFPRAFFRAAAAAAWFSASCLAARKAALLLVRGTIDGLERALLGRGLSLAAGGPAPFSVDFGSESDVDVVLGAKEGREPDIVEERWIPERDEAV